MTDLVSLGRSGASHQRSARAELGIAFSEQPELFSIPIVQTNTFVRGQLITAGETAGPAFDPDWILSSSGDRAKAADGLVIKAQPIIFWVASIFGMPVELRAHGLGPAPGTLWLQVDGSMGINRPTGGDGKALQRVGRVLGPDLILLMIEHATLV